MDSFEKLVFLPSGGLLYSPFVLIKPVTNEYRLYQTDKSLYDSVFDFQMAVLRRYVRCSFDILKMATQDFFYLWLYLYTTDLTHDTGIYLQSECADCHKSNEVFFSVDKLSVQTVNKFEAGITTNFQYTIDDVKLNFRLRVAEDNILFGNLLLNSEFSEEHWYLLALFIASQLETLQINNEVIPVNEYIGVLLYKLHFTELLEIFTALQAHNTQFGINPNVYYFCKHCNAKQKAFIYDNISGSLITPNDEFSMGQNKILDDALYLSRYKLLTYDEYMNIIPMKYLGAMRQVIDTMEFVPLL